MRARRLTTGLLAHQMRAPPVRAAPAASAGLWAQHAPPPPLQVVNAAYFSPVSGTKILTTCQDNRLRVGRPAMCHWLATGQPCCVQQHVATGQASGPGGSKAPV
jgi:hypothetical protein